MRVLPHEVLLCEIYLKLRPRLACRRILFPQTTHVGEVYCGEDQVVRHGHDLLRRVHELSCAGVVHSCLNVFDDGLKWLVDIVWRIHARCVELEVCRGDLVIVRLELIDNLQES